MFWTPGTSELLGRWLSLHLRTCTLPLKGLICLTAAYLVCSLVDTGVGS